MTTRSETVGTASERLETTPNDTASDSGPGALDLRGFLRVLRWRYKWIAALAILAVTITAATLVLMPAKYKASTIVLLDPRQPRVTNSEAVLSGIGSDAAAVESQVELIQSSALAEKVIAALNLSTDPEFITPTLMDRVRERLSSLASTPEPSGRPVRGGPRGRAPRTHLHPGNQLHLEGPRQGAADLGNAC
jgi:uncharacterized protein involved in exopolysaccharide biosynthesis